MTEERRVQLVAEVDTTRTREGFAEIGQQAAGMAQSVERSGERAERAVADVGTAAGGSARNVEAAQRSLIQSIQRTTAQMEAGSRSSAQYFEVLARQRGIDPNVLAPYLAQLRAVEQAQARATGALNAAPAALNNVGVSAAQTANAMRQVPAQFMDIVTSLQGGQAPITVLLQQGGQLRDSFGSTGAAARGLASYVTSLVTPYTVAAAAAVALAVAYNQGSKEAGAYANSLIMSGNAAGESAAMLADAARAIGKVVGTQGQAAEAVAALTATGQVGAENMQKFGRVAIEVQRNLGRSVQDTVSDFAELGKSPVQASQKLNEQYHYLTAAVLAQIKALEDQGRTEEAGEVAQNAYATAFGNRAAKMQEHLGTLERGWRGVTDFAKKAWDAMLDVGREETPQQQLDKVNAAIARAQKAFDPSVGGNAEDRANLKKNQARKVELEFVIAKDKWDAAQAAISDKLEAAQQTWDKAGDQFLSREQQRDKAIAKARNEGLAAGVSDQAINDRIAAINKSYADLYNAGVDAQIESLKRRDGVQDVLTQRELARIAALRAAGSMTEDDAINQTADAELKAFDRKREALEKEITLTKQKANSKKEVEDLEGQRKVLDEQRTNRQEQRTNDLAAAEQRRYRLAVDNTAKVIESDMAERNSLIQSTQAQLDYNAQIGLSKTQIASLTAARLLDAAARKEQEADLAEVMYADGQRAAIIRDQAKALRERAAAVVDGADQEFRYDQFKKAVDQYDQVFTAGFADMLNNGRAGWSSFTQSLVTTFKTTVADQLYKLFARPFVVQLVGSFLGVSPAAVAGEIAAGSGALGAGGTGAAGASASGAIGAAQGAAALYKAASLGFAGLSDMVAGGVQSALSAAGYTPLASQGLATASGQALTPAASMAGTAAAYGAGLLGGHYIGNAIAGDYSVNHGQAVTNIATAVGAALLGPIGGVVGGVVGGLFNRAFGMGSTEVKKQGMQGTLSATSLTGLNYTDLHQDGGWFRSDKDWQTTTPFSAATVSQFTQGLSALETASSGFAKTLGVNADAIKGYSKYFDLTLSGDAAKDQQTITDFFAGIGDELATTLVPGLDRFSKSGETAAATLQRLAGDFQATDQLAQLVGTNAVAMFGAVGLASADARERLLDLAGGASTLSQQAASYNQAFLTEAERLAPVAQAVDAALAGMGLAWITSREQFKAYVNQLVSSGAVLTEAGAKQFDDLMALNAAFAQTHPASDGYFRTQADILAERKDLQDQLDQLTLTNVELLAKQRAALDESNRALFDQVQAAKAAAAAIEQVKTNASTLMGSVDVAYAALQKVVAREKTGVQTRIDAETAVVNRLKSLSDALHSTLDTMRGSDALMMSRAQAQAQIRRALAVAKAGGPLPDADALKGALSVLTKDAASQFRTYQDYLLDLYATQGDIAQLAGLTDDSLSVEQKSLDALNQQLKDLDGVLSSMQDQIDIAKGQSTLLLSLNDAVDGVRLAIESALANPVNAATAKVNQAYQSALGRAPDAAGLAFWQQQAAAGASLDSIVGAITGSPEATIRGMYQTMLGRPPDAAGLQFWVDQASHGVSLADIGNAIAGSAEAKHHIPGFAGGGWFGGGLRVVGEDGPELEATGASRIWNTQQTAEFLRRAASPAANSDTLAAEVRRLSDALEQERKARAELEQDLRDALRSIAGHTAATASHLDDALNGNKPLATKVTT